MLKYEFSYENLMSAYKIAKKGKLSTGRDRINRAKFEKISSDTLLTVSNKIKQKTYKLTPFKEVLIIKDKKSFPRKLSIPTIRDNIVIDLVRDNLKQVFVPVIQERKVPDVIGKISDVIKSRKYSGFIKLDIKHYYDKIDHNILLNSVFKLISDGDFIHLLNIIIKTPTLSDLDSKLDKKNPNSLGVPQGISISNILGNIYLNDFDKMFYNREDICYFRYVDDLLIFCDINEVETLECQIIEELKNYKLEKNEEKRDSGELKRFSFLGYEFSNIGLISISKKNIARIRMSLEKIFSDYMSSHDKRIKGNINLLEWKINFKITGCFKNGRRYGWVIFFCQNENEKILHELDWLVKKLCIRFNLEDTLLKNGQFKGKKFSKTYKEFISKQENSDYIPNIDNFKQSDKQGVLINICKRKSDWVYSLNDFMLNREFDRFIFNSIKEIEKDLYQIYT